MVRITATEKTMERVKREPFWVSSLILLIIWLRLAESSFSAKFKSKTSNAKFRERLLARKKTWVNCLVFYASVRIIEKIECAEAVQKQHVAYLSGRYSKLMLGMPAFCHIFWNKIHNFMGNLREKHVCTCARCTIYTIFNIYTIYNIDKRDFLRESRGYHRSKMAV